jgi:protein-L-isoaspartate(D-aspartate) O-methyltransferase
LAVGGIMIIPVDVSESRQELVRISKRPKGIETEKLLDVRFVPMVEGVARDL